MTIQNPIRNEPAGPPTVLLLEPDAQRREMLGGWARRCGLSVAVPQDLARAADALAERRADAVLLSSSLASTPDSRLIESLRRATAPAHLPVVVYGTDLDGPTRAELLAGGVDEAVRLDQPDEELAARLAGVMRHNRLREELSACRLKLRRSVARSHRRIERLVRLNRQLREKALSDPLTGVHNARYFREWLATQFEIARRYKLVISVLMIDIDRFKQVNDRCGHPFGDYVLTRFAEVLVRQVRSSDMVARLGGDEFAIGLVETSRQEAVRFGRRLLRAVAGTSFEYFGRAESITISIGQAGFPEDAEITQAEQLMLFADQALYRAKDSGRNELACWHELDGEVRRRLASPAAQSQTATLSDTPALCLLDFE